MCKHPAVALMLRLDETGELKGTWPPVAFCLLCDETRRMDVDAGRWHRITNWSAFD